MKLIHLKSLSGKGNRPDQFQQNLAAVAISTNDELFALGDREVKRFAADGSLIGRIPLPHVARSLALTANMLWVADSGQIDQYDFDGNRTGQMVDKERLARITSLAVVDTELFVADATHRKVHRYSSGVWQSEIGSDVNTRRFMIPNGVLDLTWDSVNRSLLIAHPQKHRVERYDIHGALVAKFGKFGMEHQADFGGCCNPTNIATGPSGVVAISEKAPPKVKLFTSDGTYLASSPDGHFDENAKNIDLAIDSHSRVFATDARRCTIEVFQLTEDER